MNLLNYNEDIVYYIFNIINNAYDIFNVRLINKKFNNEFIRYFKFLKIYIIPRGIFINIHKCYICNKINSLHKYNKQLIYKFDRLPHKCIIHCTNKVCYLSALKKYLIDIKHNNIYPFCEITDKFILDNYFIKKYYIDNVKKCNNKWYIECEDIHSLRYYKINNIENLKNNNLFPWFLNRKKELINI